MRRGRRLVDRLEWDRRGLRRRRQQGVDPVERRQKRPLHRVALGERSEIVGRADAAAGLDTRAHRRVDRQDRVVDQPADQLVGLRGDDPAGRHCRIGKAAGQGEIDDLGPLPRQRIERGVVGGEHLGAATVALGLRHPGEAQPADAALEPCRWVIRRRR